jgi:hypothetical protein
MHEAEFPPNKKEILARLTDPVVNFLDFDSLTCDEAAQLISDIDGNGFNQADADGFEHISLLINRGIIAKTIPSIERDGKAYIKTLDVVKWAIARAETKEYEMPSYVLNWFEKQNTTLVEEHQIPDCIQDHLKQIGTNESHEQPSTSSDWQDNQNLLKLEKQHFAILDVIKKKGFNPMLIPDGEKGTIEKLCQNDFPLLFDSESSFNTAWKSGRDLFKMANHASYAKRGK